MPCRDPILEIVHYARRLSYRLASDGIERTPQQVVLTLVRDFREGRGRDASLRERLAMLRCCWRDEVQYAVLRDLCLAQEI